VRDRLKGRLAVGSGAATVEEIAVATEVELVVDADNTDKDELAWNNFKKKG